MHPCLDVTTIIIKMDCKRIQLLKVYTIYTLTSPKTFTQHCVFDKYLYYSRVSVNNLHLHKIYIPYIWLLTLTFTRLVGTKPKASAKRCSYSELKTLES